RGRNPNLEVVLRPKKVPEQSMVASTAPSPAKETEAKPLAPKESAGKESANIPPPPQSRPSAFTTPWANCRYWSVREGELQQRATAGNNWLLFGDPTWTDYDFEVDATPMTGGSEVEIGLRAAGPSNLLYLALGGSGNTEHALMVKRGRSTQKLCA